MANVNGRDLRVARIYAKAMLDLAVAEKQEDGLLDELDELRRAIAGDEELAAFLASPLVSGAARAEVIERVFRRRASDLLVDALEVINRKGRLGLLAAIAVAYRGEYRELRGLVDAQVTTAVPLGKAQRASLAAAVAKLTGKQPDLIERVDPSILGGLVVEVAGEKIDSSLATRLRDVGTILAQRAAVELHRGGGADSETQASEERA
ncbi:MAG TPA: ATP synthase F1 subunit delta [Thermoanaerobaculia bacterium]|nr:ATP synthase F1 subunit delta [Thermoanaerobaculia bacterium]